jgi:uncharacterized protein (TIGR00730 family)
MSDIDERSGRGGKQRRPRNVPPPPHPIHRREPLPWEHPKPDEEDPEAWEKIEVILRNPSYRTAIEDAQFLSRDDARGPRLEIDYLKPQRILEDHEIDASIVVFGSTRIPEPSAASRRVELLKARVEHEADDPELRRQLRVAERILDKSRYYSVARDLGRLVGEAGKDNPARRLVIMTGGGPGIMEAANRGAYDVGAPSVGLNIALPREQYPNPYVTPDLCFRLHYFAIRKLHLLLRAKALIAFPGGYGTLDELFETLTLVQTRKITPIPIVLVGEDYWRRAVDIDFLVDEGVIDAEDRDLFWYAETAMEIWDGIVAWHAATEEPLLGRDGLAPPTA